jgi:hypothetical protein
LPYKGIGGARATHSPAAVKYTHTHTHTRYFHSPYCGCVRHVGRQRALRGSVEERLKLVVKKN